MLMVFDSDVQGRPGSKGKYRVRADFQKKIVECNIS